MTKWDGSAIKRCAKAQGLSLSKLAEQIGVKCQDVNNWIGGQIPKGIYLIKICDILKIDPDELFTKEPDESIQILKHKGVKMTINDLSLEQIVKYNGYNFRVTGFRTPDIVYIKPVGIAKKVYRGEIAVKISGLLGINFDRMNIETGVIEIFDEKDGTWKPNHCMNNTRRDK
jgi:transcriptional regulator with XRE-family HTH domain